MANLMDALNTPVGDIERPPLPPLGTYQWVVTKQPSFETIANGAYETCDFVCKVVAPTGGVDTDELAAYGDITKRYQQLRFMFDVNDKAKFDQSLFRLRTFLENVLKCADESMSLKEALANAVNHQFLGEVKYRPDKNDKEIMYAEFGATAPIE